MMVSRPSLSSNTVTKRYRMGTSDVMPYMSRWYPWYHNNSRQKHLMSRCAFLTALITASTDSDVMDAGVFRATRCAT